MGFDRKSFLLAVVVLLAVTVPVASQTRSEREERDYVGSVRTVRTEIQPVEDVDTGLLGDRRIETTEVFARDGNLLEETQIDDWGKLWKTKVNTIEEGRVSETSLVYLSQSELSRRLTYLYDSKGQLIDVNEYELDGTLYSHELISYNERGLVAENLLTIYDSGSIKTYRRLCRYDQRGLRIELQAFVDEGAGFLPTTDSSESHRRTIGYSQGKYWDTVLKYNVDGSFAGKLIVRRDEHGNVVENTEYDAELNIGRRFRFEYKFDAAGNWIEQRTCRWVQDSERAQYYLESVRYRTITYFKN